MWGQVSQVVPFLFVPNFVHIYNFLRACYITLDTIGKVTIKFNSLFIYVLSSTANGQLQSQHEYKQQQ
jgi:hypothetical protein